MSSRGTYCVQAGLVAGEGEGEAQRQAGALHAHVVQEVGDAVHDVVEELGRDGAVSESTRALRRN